MNYVPAASLKMSTSQVNSNNFDIMILKFSEKCDHPFSHDFIFGNMFPENHGFVPVPVKRANNFVSLLYLDSDKLEHVSLIQFETRRATKP